MLCQLVRQDEPIEQHIDNNVYLSSVNPFHQFVWCKYLHLWETKPLFAQIFDGCSNVIHIIVYAKETVMW